MTNQDCSRSKNPTNFSRGSFKMSCDVRKPQLKKIDALNPEAKEQLIKYLKCEYDKQRKTIEQLKKQIDFLKQKKVIKNVL